LIYLDHNADTPARPEVIDAMVRWLRVPANPASVHALGQAARVAVEEARDRVAALVGGNPAGVVFTSGATEANHTFFAGVDPTALTNGVAASRMEHPCVLRAVERLEAQGVPLTWLSVSGSGRVELTGRPSLIALQAANHETGVLQPVQEALSSGAMVHVDATQAVGRVPLDLSKAAGVALSGHKFGGPPGVGALILPDGEPRRALMPGAQERGRRGGTVNTAGAVGLGVAAELALQDLAERQAQWSALQAHLEKGLTHLGGRVIGADEPRVANTSLVVFDGIEGETLVQALDLHGVAVSSGAACASGSVEPSPVLVAMGEPWPKGGLRTSFGRDTTADELDRFFSALGLVLSGLRDTF